MERHVIIGASTGPRSLGTGLSLYENDDQRVAIDPGVQFGRDRNTHGADLSYIQDGREINAVVLTHLHLDHIGFTHALAPYLAEDAKIWGAPQTLKALKIVSDEAYKFGQAELMDMLDVTDPLRHMVPKVGENEILPGLMMYADPNGHAPGSFSPSFRYRSGKVGRILSDWGFQNLPTVYGADLPSQSVPRDWLPDIVMGTDITYGDGMRRLNREAEKERFGWWMLKILDRGGKVIVPALRFVRGQDMAIDIGKIAASLGISVPIYVDGGIRLGFQIFLENPWSAKDRTDFLMEMGEIRFVEDPAHREELANSTDPMIIISSAGMMSGGPVMRYLTNSLPNPNHGIAIVCFQAEGTMGREILEKAGIEGAEVELPVGREADEFGRPLQTVNVPIRANIERFQGFSGHCDLFDSEVLLDDMVKARNGKPLEGLALTHGTPSSKRNAYAKLNQFVEPGKTFYGSKNRVIKLNEKRLTSFNWTA